MICDYNSQQLIILQKIRANNSFICYATPNSNFLVHEFVAREKSLDFQLPRIDNSVYSHVHKCENGPPLT